MKWERVSEEGKRYLKIPLFNECEKNEILSEYEINILNTDSVKGMAKVIKKKMNGEWYLLFQISTCISLKEKFEQEYLNVEEFCTFFKELLQVYDNMKVFLLDRSMLCLEPEYIFFNEKERKYVFLPIDGQVENVAEKYEILFTFFADICSVDESPLLEYIFDAFSSLSENGFDEMSFVKDIIYHRYEKSIVIEEEDTNIEEADVEEDFGEVSKIKGTLIISGGMLFLAFWFVYICQEMFTYSVVGIALSILAVLLIGYTLSKKIYKTKKN